MTELVGSEENEFPSVETFTWNQAWLLALTRPSEETYEKLIMDPLASLQRAMIWIFTSTMISTGVLFGLQLLMIQFFGGSAFSELDELSSTGFLTGSLLLLICLLPLSGIATVLGQLVYGGVVQFISGAFGGRGTYTELVYAVAAYTAPMTLLTALLALIPFVNVCLGFPLSIYGFTLNLLAIKSVHQFGWGSAFATVFVMILIMVLIMVIIFAVVLSPLIDALLSNTLLTP
jgi:hypothetical protein